MKQNIKLLSGQFAHCDLIHSRARILNTSTKSRFNIIKNRAKKNQNKQVEVIETAQEGLEKEVQKILKKESRY